MVVLQLVMDGMLVVFPPEVTTTARHVLHSTCVCNTSSLLNPK